MIPDLAARTTRHRIVGGLALFAALYNSVAPSMLYAGFQSRWHLGEAMTSLMFAVYALGAAATLLANLALRRFGGSVAGRMRMRIGLISLVGSGICLIWAGSPQIVLLGRLLGGIGAGLLTAEASALIRASYGEGMDGNRATARLATMAFTGGAIMAPATYVVLTETGLQAGPILMAIDLALACTTLALAMLWVRPAVTAMLEHARHPSAPGAIPPAALSSGQAAEQPGHRSAAPIILTASRRTEPSDFPRAAACLILSWAMGGLYLSIVPMRLVTKVEIAPTLFLALMIMMFQCFGFLGQTVELRHLRARGARLKAGLILTAAMIPASAAAVATGSTLALLGATAATGFGYGMIFVDAVALAAATFQRPGKAHFAQLFYLLGYLGQFLVVTLIGAILDQTGGSRLGYATAIWAVLLSDLLLLAWSVIATRRAARAPVPDGPQRENKPDGRS